MSVRSPVPARSIAGDSLAPHLLRSTRPRLTRPRPRLSPRPAPPDPRPPLTPRRAPRAPTDRPPRPPRHPPQAVAAGTLSMVSSDHSPAPPADKLLDSGDFLRAWGGISSLQLSLPATWTQAAARGLGLVEMAGECPPHLNPEPCPEP